MSWKYYTETKFFVQKILYKFRKLEIYRLANFLTVIKIELLNSFQGDVHISEV